jgi:NAD(P)-dependent dehydrogenase (short-subunit alcohol dehydrogenase family)
MAMSSLVVVGAGPGLGAAVARRCSEAGDAVTLLSRDVASLRPLADELTRAGRWVDVLGADVADEAALTIALDRIVTGGIPDVVVYNAALVRRDRPGDLSHEEHAHAWAVNVVGAIAVASRLLPRMAERGTGTFLLTGGLPQPDFDRTSLSLGKAGLRALTSVLADEYTGRGVHVATVVVAGAVAPGTPFDPDRVAREFLRLHRQRRNDWQHEVVFRGAPPVDTPSGE